jgi:hypothetical protein
VSPDDKRPAYLAPPLRVGEVTGCCIHCLDTGHVCENHPDYPWHGLAGPVEGHTECGGAGMPCGWCCSPIPQDGTRSIAEAFTPDWQR